MLPCASTISAQEGNRVEPRSPHGICRTVPRPAQRCVGWVCLLVPRRGCRHRGNSAVPARAADGKTRGPGPVSLVPHASCRRLCTPDCACSHAGRQSVCALEPTGVGRGPPSRWVCLQNSRQTASLRVVKYLTILCQIPAAARRCARLGGAHRRRTYAGEDRRAGTRRAH